MRSTAHNIPSEGGPDSDAELNCQSAADIQILVARAHERAPAKTSWGFFSYDDAPAGIGGGCGAFLWFDSHPEMVDFIGTYLPFRSAGASRRSPTEVATRVKGILAEMCLNPDGNSEGVRTRLNDLLKGYTNLVWWGPFDELLSGSNEFAREVRRWFHSSRMADKADAPIEADQQEEFVQAIQEYGL
jgi:hypothetical protein